MFLGHWAFARSADSSRRQQEGPTLVKTPAIGALLLALVPFVAVCFSVPLWDRVYPLMLGLPFNLFWLICWIPLTSVCLWGAYVLHSRNKGTGGAQ